MRRMGKRFFAAVLAAALLFAMPGMTLYAEAADGQGESVAESAAAQAALDPANEPVTVDEPTEGAVAQVEIAGSITYHNTIEEAWTAANGNTATITLLADVTANDTLTVNDGTTITFDGGDHTLTSGQQTAIQVNGTLKLESGTIQSTYSNLDATGINVNGTLEMTGGTVTTRDRLISGSVAVKTNSNSNITISGGKISGVYGVDVNNGTVTIQKGEISGRAFALYILSGTLTIEGGTFTGSIYSGLCIVGGTVILCGGTFTCGDGGYTIQSNNDISTLLDTTKPYVYFDANGQPVNLSELEDPTKLPNGTYMVGECTHDGAETTSKNNGTHTLNCPYCGYTGTADCSYTFKENENVGTCTCGDKLTVVADPAPLTYNGAAQEPGVTVKRGDTVLAASAYSVAYGNNTNAGAASVTVTIGNNQGTCRITFPIGKATPDITALPTAARITYGQTLGDSVLSGGAAADGSTAIAGTFGWKTPSAKPTAADSGVTQYTAVFTPDSANYNSVEITLTLTVQKAPNAPNMPDSAMRVPYTVKTAGSAPLPEGWAWQAPGRDTALEVDAPAQAVAVYAGADKDNYENVTVTVTLTRAACGHAEWEILYTGEGEKAPSCTGAGLGHKECAICGEVLETGIAAPALGHAYKSAVTTQPSAGSDGVRTYTCTRCGDTYTEAIEKLPGEDTEKPDGKDEKPKDNPQTSLPEAPDKAGGGTAQTPPPAQPEAPASNDTPAVQSPQTDHPGSAWLFVISGILAAAAAGTGIFFLVKKKKKDV